jgi:hypothetical protein
MRSMWWWWCGEQTYYAGPKEGLTNYRMRHALEHDVINRLLQRISDDRLGLIDHFRSVEQTHGIITRYQRPSYLTPHTSQAGV